MMTETFGGGEFGLRSRDRVLGKMNSRALESRDLGLESRDHKFTTAGASEQFLINYTWTSSSLNLGTIIVNYFLIRPQFIQS